MEYRPVRTLDGQSEIQYWYQLVVKNRVGPCLTETSFGFDPLYTSSKDSKACPLGHTRGLNLLSELYLHEKQLKGLDIAMTTDYIGGIAAIQAKRRKCIFNIMKD